MRIEDFKQIIEVADEDAIRGTLERRHAHGMNAFWLSHGSEKHPVLAIHVRHELASLHFFRRERDAGLVSVGNAPGLESGASTVFHITETGEEISVLNEFVVTISTASSVAIEFARAPNLPRTVEWIEL